MGLHGVVPVSSEGSNEGGRSQNVLLSFRHRGEICSVVGSSRKLHAGRVGKVKWRVILSEVSSRLLRDDTQSKNLVAGKAE